MKSLDTQLLDELIQYHKRMWVLVNSADDKFAVIDNSMGIKFVTKWCNDAREAIAEAGLKLRNGDIEVDD